MYFFGEGYWLLRQTWKATLRFWIPFYLLVYPLSVLAGSQSWAVAGIVLPSWIAPASLAVYMACLPAKWYVDLVLMSSPYYGESVDLWALVKQGWSNWWRLAQLSVLTLLATAPLYALWFTMRHAGWRVLNVVQVWSTVLALYMLFAALSTIRTRLPVLASVVDAIKLVPWNEWLQTIALLTALDLLYHFATASLMHFAWLRLPFVREVTPPSRALLSLSLRQFAGRALNFLPGWYLQLCAVAVWHRHKYDWRLPKAERTVTACPLSPETTTENTSS